MSQAITVSAMDGIATVIMHRPEKRNALDGILIRELTDAFHRLAHDQAISVVILRAEGEHFCSGGDIAWMKGLADATSKIRLKEVHALAELFYTLYTFAKPLIALTQGNTLGGGLGLIATADIVIAASDAHFCFSEVKMGLVPSIVSPYIIAALGERMARYYFLTAKMFDVKEAKEIGLIQDYVHAHQLVSAGLKVAHDLLQHNLSALQAIKALTQSIVKESITPQLSLKTAHYLSERLVTPEASEGLQAFLEKRKPVWTV